MGVTESQDREGPVADPDVPGSRALTARSQRWAMVGRILTSMNEVIAPIWMIDGRMDGRMSPRDSGCITSFWSE